MTKEDWKEVLGFTLMFIFAPASWLVYQSFTWTRVETLLIALGTLAQIAMYSLFFYLGGL